MKRIISIILVTLLILSLIPLSVFSIFAEVITPENGEFQIVTNVVNGNISETKNIPEGGSYKVEYRPRTVRGYVLDSVKVDGTDVDLVQYKDSYTFTDIKASHTIEVVYLRTYPVTFDTNGGSRIMPQTIKEGSKIIKPEDPTKTGYTFKDWYEDEDCTEKFNFDTPITEPTTIYADYTEIEYTLHYDANGGISTSAPEDQIMVISDEARVSFIEPAWPGHTFKGWSTDSDAKTASYLPGDTFKAPGIDKAPDTTLYAVWNFDVVQINYKANNGGYVDPTAETILADPDPSETLGGSKAKSNEGYHFVEWKDENNEVVCKRAEFTPKKPGDLFLPATYTAFFDINEYTVTFDMQGLVSDFTETVKHGNHATAKKVETIKGYDFDNYYQDEDRLTPFKFDEIPIIKDTTVYGNFIEHTADLTYYKNDGTDAVFMSEKLKYSEQTVIIDVDPEREHYVFLGWDKNPEASEPTYSKGSTAILKEANVEPEKIELYAIWEKESVHYNIINTATIDDKDKNGGYIEVADSALAKDNVEVKVTPNEGYIIKSLSYTDKSGKSTVINKNEDGKYVFIMPESDISITAIFEKVGFKITYDANGGTVSPESEIITEPKDITKLPVPIKEGCVFLGWSTSKEEEKYVTGTITDSVTLYAIWKDATITPDPEEKDLCTDPIQILGAQYRDKTDTLAAGLRFVIRISDAYYDLKNAEYGCALFTKEGFLKIYTEEDELTADSKDEKGTSAGKDIDKEICRLHTDYRTYYIVIVSNDLLPEGTLHSTDFIARPYVKYTDNNGKEQYVYYSESIPEKTCGKGYFTSFEKVYENSVSQQNLSVSKKSVPSGEKANNKTLAQTGVSDNTYILGDATEDDKLSISDATYLQLCLANCTGRNLKLYNAFKFKADANQDNIINISDVTAIQQRLAKITSNNIGNIFDLPIDPLDGGLWSEIVK